MLRTVNLRVTGTTFAMLKIRFADKFSVSNVTVEHLHLFGTICEGGSCITPLTLKSNETDYK